MTSLQFILRWKCHFMSLCTCQEAVRMKTPASHPGVQLPRPPASWHWSGDNLKPVMKRWSWDTSNENSWVWYPEIGWNLGNLGSSSLIGYIGLSLRLNFFPWKMTITWGSISHWQTLVRQTQISNSVAYIPIVLYPSISPLLLVKSTSSVGQIRILEIHIVSWLNPVFAG